jgi:D-ribose pyranose/furanose isomerase RbsD
MGRRMVALLEQAMACAKSNPAPAPPLPLAVTLATEAIEQMRLNNFAEEMRRERNQLTDQLSNLSSRIDQLNEIVDNLSKERNDLLNQIRDLWRERTYLVNQLSMLELGITEQNCENMRFQVYFSRNGSYCEDDSISLDLDGQSSMILSLQTECGMGSGALRIDPTNAPGLIWIDVITIRLHDGEVVWTTATRAHFDSITVTGTALPIPCRNGICLLSYGNDPQLVLPTFPGQPVNKPAIIEVRLRLEPVRELANNLLRKQTVIGRLKTWFKLTS